MNVSAKVIDDPLTVFRVQANGLVTFAMIGLNAQFAIGVRQPGDPAFQRAGRCRSTPRRRRRRPSRSASSIFITDPPGSNGTDTTTPYNWAYVTFNNQDFKSLTGI